MEQHFVTILSFLYGAAGIITFLGFMPTIKDLWKKKPSANATTYIVWASTTFVTFLYAVFIVEDLLFSVVISLQLLACLIILFLRLRIKEG